MKRRRFLAAAAAMPAAAALPVAAAPPSANAQASVAHAASAQTATRGAFDPQPGRWRTWELVTRIEVAQPEGAVRAWVPLPSVDDTYQQTLGSAWRGNARSLQPFSDGRYGAAMLHAQWDAAERAPWLEVTSQVRTQDRSVDWSRRAPVQEDAATLRFWTRGTELMPIDGIVRETARDIVRGKRGDVEKTQAIYDWIVANTFREPTVRGCGVGDIKAMLETGNLGGKCGDINALFVGLARSAGIPARDVYGIRLGPSAFGYRALGTAGPDVSKAQHCRAEVFLRDHGWVAMDPADVAKVMREETPQWIRAADHPIVAPVKAELFGGWEGNWLAYNRAHDVRLPNAADTQALGFLMYPQAETAAGRLDALDPEGFRYTITAREVETREGRA